MNRRIALLLVLCCGARPASTVPPRPIQSTFDVQHIGVVTDEVPASAPAGRARRPALRHYTVATVRASFDQPLYVRRDGAGGADPVVERSGAIGGANATRASR